MKIDDLDDEVVYEFVLSVANNEERVEFEEVILWIKNHTHISESIHAKKE